MTTEIKIYDPLRAQLAELKELNRNLIFEYETPEGNKAARSHVYKLRQSKSAVENARKEEKAASLEYGRKVDAEAKALTSEIEEMIAVHQTQIDAIEEREKNRIQSITQRIEKTINAGRDIDALSSTELRQRIDSLQEVPTEELYQEFLAVQEKERTAALDALTAALARAEKREADAAELEALRKEKEARDAAEAEAQRKRDEDARIEKAKNEAVEKEKQAAAQREQELKDQVAKAEQDAKDAAEKERQRIEREAKEAQEAEARRAADRDHKAAIHGDIIVALDKVGVNEELAKAIIIAIARGEIPHITIRY